MVRQLILLPLVVLSACAVPIPRPAPTIEPLPSIEPAPIPQSAKERFLRAVEMNGCEVNESNSNIILQDATLSQADLARILTELQNEGRGAISADQRGFQVTSGACA